MLFVVFWGRAGLDTAAAKAFLDADAVGADSLGGKLRAVVVEPAEGSLSSGGGRSRQRRASRSPGVGRI